MDEIVGENRAATGQARAVARAAHAAWRKAGGTDRIDVLVGTVAALALHGLTTPEQPAGYVAELGPSGLRAWLKDFWAAAWIVRPDLVIATRPLTRWLEVTGREGRCLARASRLAATAALDAGIFEFIETRRLDADLLGYLITDARPAPARSELGLFHTPGSVSALIAAIAWAGSARTRFSDKSCGSGQRARVAAAALRAEGRDPAELHWYLNDLDPLAAACAAVNAWLWGLGPHVLIGSMDALETPGWEPVAEQVAEQARADRDRAINAEARAASILKAVTLPGLAPLSVPARHRITGAPMAADRPQCGQCGHVTARMTTRGWRSRCELSPTRRRGPDVPADLPACALFTARSEANTSPYALLTSVPRCATA